MKSEMTRPVAGSVLRPFKVRNFNLLFDGQTVSVIGDALYVVALPWLILSNGGNAQDLGIVLADGAFSRPARMRSLSNSAFFYKRSVQKRSVVLACSRVTASSSGSDDQTISTTRTRQARSRAMYLQHSMLIPQMGSGFSRL
jgi:hypothetical protein